MRNYIYLILVLASFSSFAQSKIVNKKQNNSKKTISKHPLLKTKEPKVIHGEEVTLREIMRAPDPVALEKPDENYIYEIYEIEIKPEFSRNSKLLPIFLAENIKYSDNMKMNQIKGDVLSSFVVESDGSLSNIKIQNGFLGYGIENEILRIFSIMPKWQPASLNGKNVKCLSTLSINIDATKQ